MKIRKGVFETNSSSSHSLTISDGEIVGQPSVSLVKNIRNGDYYIIVSGGDFGWAEEDFYDTDTKLSYLFTYLFGNHSENKLKFFITEHTDDGLLFTDSLEWVEFMKYISDSDMAYDDEKVDMINRVVDVVTEFTGYGLAFSDNSFSGYIDHQSASLPREEGLLTCDYNIRQFLFNSKSSLHTGNDNG